MPQFLDDATMRALIQMPARAYSDAYPYDGTPYFDLSRREIVSILTASGTRGGVPYLFRLNTDFAVNYSVIDWTLPGALKPDLGTPFTTEYTYSRLGSAAASTSMWAAQIQATQDLGSAFPYGSTTAAGIAYNDVAKLTQLLLAAAYCCEALTTSDIDISEKVRRGTIVIDDTKKSDDWETTAKNYYNKYHKMLILARGQVRGFGIAVQDITSKVFDGSDIDPTTGSIVNTLFGGGFW